MTGALEIRPAETCDNTALWAILEPVIRAGETYPLPREWDREQSLAYWRAAHHQTFVAALDGRIVGTYYLRPNNLGSGGHIANCGYMVGAATQGRGVASAMCQHSLDVARQSGFTGMQYNFVLTSNPRAMALWTRMGFETIGRLPKVFDHPSEGMVDALVMFQAL